MEDTGSPDPLDEMGRRFEVRMAEEHSRARPEDLDALRALAYAYTAAGHYEQALTTDLELVARDPKRADLRYDLACSYALLCRSDDAFAALDQAITLGFDDGECLRGDDDLASLRGDPRWQAILARVPLAAG